MFLEDFVNRMRRANAGATVHQIDSAQRALGVVLHEAHRALLTIANGMEGAPSKGKFIALWSTEGIPRMNGGYQVALHAPMFWLFGTNMGGAGYACRKGARLDILDIPLTPMDAEDAVVVAPNFDVFLRQLVGKSA